MGFVRNYHLDAFAFVSQRMAVTAIGMLADLLPLRVRGMHSATPPIPSRLLRPCGDGNYVRAHWLPVKLRREPRLRSYSADCLVRKNHWITNAFNVGDFHQWFHFVLVASWLLFAMLLPSLARSHFPFV